MQLGLIGLGRMGGNMRERLRRAGHTVIGFDRNPEVRDVESLEAMEATFTGEPLTIGFNPQYLIDGLQNLGAQTAVLSFVDAFKPAVISPAAEDGEIVPGYRYLIMPIRVTR